MKNPNRQLDKQRKCLSRASKKSAKASDLTRSLVFAGFGLIWVILQADKLNIKNLKIGTDLGYATTMLCIAVIFEFIYLMFNVSINLYQGWTNKFFSEPTMKKFIGVQWFLWFAKALAVIVGYVFILLSLM